MDQEPEAWTTVWRLFKGSLFHLSLHAAYSDFKGYAPWAKGKSAETATFAVSLVEDMHITYQAMKNWRGVLPDIAYSNYISALRINEPNEIDPGSYRLAAKLLLATSGVLKPTESRLFRDEDVEVLEVAKRVWAAVGRSVGMKAEDRRVALSQAAEEVYSIVADRGQLREIPYFPYTEAHGKCDLFEAKLLETQDRSEGLLSSALAHVGLEQDTGVDDQVSLGESREVLANMESGAHKEGKIRSFYEKLAAPTRLENVEFPSGDYAAYQRIRADLAGPIKNVRDQLRLVRNVLDDVTGHESGQQLDTQAAMQVMASQQARSDVFEQLEPMHKEEAWAILLDASKSLSAFAHEARGIATCLGEVARSLMGQQGFWAMYSFNNSFQVIKDFDEDYGIVSKARIGGMSLRNTTLLPDAMRVAYKTLAQRSAAVRILVVVSDGYASGYNGIQQKMIDVVKEIDKSGVLLMGVGVDSNAIKDYFRVNCVMRTPYEMMKTFVKSYFELSYSF